MQIDVDTFHLGRRNGISRDGEEIIACLNEKYNVREVTYSDLRFPAAKYKIKFLNILNLLTKVHIRIPSKFDGVFFQPHLSILSPGRNSIAWIIRLHDIFPITNPEWFEWWSRRIFKKNLKHAINNGAYFLFSSQNSRDVFLGYFPECQGRVGLVSCFNSELGKDRCLKCEGCIVLASGFLSSPFILSVGTIEPRKNYEFLTSFWEDNYKKLEQASTLVIVGSPGWKTNRLQKRIKRLRKANLLWLRNCCDGSLHTLYANAECFVSTSKDEGFNLPAYESRLNYGLPLLLSDILVHREIHGSKATYFSTPLELLEALNNQSKPINVATPVNFTKNKSSIYENFDIAIQFRKTWAKK